MNGIKLLLDETLALQAQQGQVVETGVGRWFGDRIELDVGVTGGDDFLRLSKLEESVVVPDLDASEVEGIVAQFDLLGAEVSGDGVAVRFEGDGSCLGDRALDAMQEGLTQFLRIRGTGGRGRILPEPFERGLTGLGVELAMVDDLKPGQERLVELGQGGDVGLGEFGQEIGLDELEEAFDLA